MHYSLFQIWRHCLQRELLLIIRQPTDWLNPLLFFVMVISLFPLGISPAPTLLRTIAPGVIWVAALLSMLLSVDKLFKEDFQDGTLEQFFLSPYPLPLIVLGKICAYWLAAGLPLLILAPVFSMLLNIPAQGLFVLLATLALGTPILSFVGAIGAALTVSIRNSNILLPLILLPLYIPVVIFATSAVNAAVNGTSFTGQLAILGAILILALLCAPITIAAGLRASLG